LSQAILGLPVADTQFGFKAFARAPVLPIVENLRQCRFSFDAELLFAVWRSGLSMCELDIRMIERRPRVRHAILLWAPQMFMDLLFIRFHRPKSASNDESYLHAQNVPAPKSSVRGKQGPAVVSRIKALPFDRSSGA